MCWLQTIWNDWFLLPADARKELSGYLDRDVDLR